MRVNRPHTASSPISGFTLIELCICLIIMGFLVMPLARTYFNAQKAQMLKVTRENVNDVGIELAQFSSASGRLPCPSDRSIPPSDARFGRELGSLNDPFETEIMALPVCGGPGASQGICRTNGARDTDVDTDTAPDLIIIGGVPITSLQEGDSSLPTSKIIDAWGGQLTYAVSARLCQSPPYTSNRVKMHTRGVIAGIDENDNPTAGIGTRDLSIPPDGTLDPDAMFVLLSHGENGNGAFSGQGTSLAACDTTLLESENCDNDFTFMSALIDSRANSNLYFDDIIYFHLTIQENLWMPISYIDPTGQIVTTRDLRNLNDGNVGILTETPSERLHVNGNLRSDSVNTNRICSVDGTRCFDTDFLGTERSTGTVNRNTCAANQVVTRIGNNTVACGVPALQAPGVVNRCTSPSAPYIRGILSNGEVICTN